MAQLRDLLALWDSAVGHLAILEAGVPITALIRTRSFNTTPSLDALLLLESRKTPSVLFHSKEKYRNCSLTTKMRLINIYTQALHPPTTRPPRYTILSHTWEDREMSFQEAQTHEGHISLRYWEGSPYPDSWKKIFRACRVADKEGYGYIWVDTCCIDKTNSTELSEAINSMFRWYAEAEVCYVYLSDVPDEDDVRHRHSYFRASRWFKRGWTLQELLAPKEVHFYSKDWKLLGTKEELSDLISEITRIPREILMSGDCQAPSRSIGEIFSWASRRQTTLEEDLAYSLLGLLDINMTLIYGEGSKAFIRVQEELLRTYDDESIFAWEAPPNQAIAQPLFGLLSPKLAHFEASHRFVKPRIWTRLDTNPLTITNKGISLDMPLIREDNASKPSLALLNCRIIGSDESEVQPAIRVQSLGGKRYARIDVHHIIPVRFATAIPRAQAVPSACSLIFPRDPTAPLPVTAFLINPNQILIEDMWLPSLLRPARVTIRVPQFYPASNWTQLWDNGLVIESSIQRPLHRRRSRRDLAQSMEGTDDTTNLYLVGVLKVEYLAEELFGPAYILVGHEETRDTAHRMMDRTRYTIVA